MEPIVSRALVFCVDRGPITGGLTDVGDSADGGDFFG
jgi:hypothetical protein